MGARFLSFVPKRGHIPSNWGGGMGAVRAHMCPENPMHEPNAPRAKGKTHDGRRPLSSVPKRGNIYEQPPKLGGVPHHALEQRIPYPLFLSEKTANLCFKVRLQVRLHTVMHAVTGLVTRCCVLPGYN